MTGVRLKGGAVINAPVVISAAGWRNTFERLIPADVLSTAAGPYILQLHFTPQLNLTVASLRCEVGELQ